MNNLDTLSEFVERNAAAASASYLMLAAALKPLVEAQEQSLKAFARHLVELSAKPRTK